MIVTHGDRAFGQHGTVADDLSRVSSRGDDGVVGGASERCLNGFTSVFECEGDLTAIRGQCGGACAGECLCGCAVLDTQNFTFGQFLDLQRCHGRRSELQRGSLPFFSERESEFDRLCTSLVGDETEVIVGNDDARILRLHGGRTHSNSSHGNHVPGTVEVLHLHLGDDRACFGIKVIKSGQQGRRDWRHRFDLRRRHFGQCGGDEAFEFAVGDAHLAFIKGGGDDGFVGLSQ